MSAELTRRLAALRWRCPACGARYESPVPVVAVLCGDRAAHPDRDRVHMRPEPEQED